MKPRVILAIETSTRSGSVALMEGDGAPIERFLESGAFQGRELAPGIQALLDAGRLSPQDVDLVAVGLGPGSYTGLRVGIVMARTFAYAADCGVVGVSSFAALASSAEETDKEILCVAKAGREEYYYALFTLKHGLPRLVQDHAIGSRDAVADLLTRQPVVLGEGNFEIQKDAPREGHAHLPAAGQVARLGLLTYLEGGPTPEDCLSPLYLRRSKAEINWERREASRRKDQGNR